MSATVDCRDCDATGLVDGDWCWTCGGQTFLYRCADCRDPITGCIWTGGRCLDCHEAGLLPMSAQDLWDEAYA